MQNTAKRQLRAYISGRPKFISSFDETHIAWARFDILNSGTTPANEAEHWAIVDVFPYPLPAGFVLPTGTPSSGKATCFPSLPSEGRVLAAGLFTPAEITAIRNGTGRIYVYGEILYRHSFDRGRTRFGAWVGGTPDMLGKLDE